MSESATSSWPTGAGTARLAALGTALLVLAWAAGAGPLGAAAIALLSVAGARWAAGSRFEVGRPDDAARIEALATAHDQLRSLVECVPEAVLLVGDDGAIQLANPAAMGLFTFESLGTEGLGLQPVLEGELGERAAQAWAAIARPGVGMEHERQRIEITGIEHHGMVLDLVAVPARSARTGRHAGTALIVLDKTREHELARLKDEFLSNISHELCTPLTNICSYSELLLGLGPEDSEQWPEFVKIVQGEGQRLARMVEAVLEHVREERGELRLDPEPVDFGKLIETLVALHSHKATEKSIACEVRTGVGPLVVHADRVRMSQVLSNLLDNALKFTPSEGRVRVTAERRGDQIEVGVEDSGPGIAPEMRELAFERFRQIADVLTEKPPGTGLGLARCRLLVQRHGGLIWCEDSPLGGAGFRVLLPALGAGKRACH